MNVSISDSEWIVLEILWKENHLSADEVVERIPSLINWKPNTVKTLINRLVKKNVVGFNKVGRCFIFYPLVKQEDCLRTKNRSILKTLYGGVIRNLFAAFVDEFVMNENEITEIRELLEKKEQELNNRSKK